MKDPLQEMLRKRRKRMIADRNRRLRKAQQHSAKDSPLWRLSLVLVPWYTAAYLHGTAPIVALRGWSPAARWWLGLLVGLVIMLVSTPDLQFVKRQLKILADRR